MLGIPPGAAAAATPHISLRKGFIATFAGNVAFAASQWAALSLIARLGGAEMLGEYALALAIATPVALFSHLNLRAVLGTDMERRHPFGDYLAVRLGTIALGVLAVAGIALAGRYAWPVAAVIVAVGVVLSADNLSDIYYAAMQRRDRMDQIGGSTAVRGALSALALGLALWLTHNLLAAVAAQAAGRIGGGIDGHIRGPRPGRHSGDGAAAWVCPDAALASRKHASLRNRRPLRPGRAGGLRGPGFVHGCGVHHG